MAGLLPSKPDIDPNDEPRVVGLDSDDADELIDALSSSTTRTILAALHEEPASPSGLAERVDTSLQNVQYHLGKLEDAGLVEVGDTVYSEKGREMKVYVPADRALIVVAGREEETTGLKAALSRLLGGVGVLGLASVVVDRLARGGAPVGLGASGGAESADDAGDGGATAPPEATSGADTGASGGGAATPTPEPTATDAAATVTEADGGFDIAEATTTTTAPTEAATATATDAAATATQTAMATPAPTATRTATEAATQTATTAPEATTTPVSAEVTSQATTTVATAAQPGLLDGLATSPGLLFFLGGTTVLLGGFALWWLRQ